MSPYLARQFAPFARTFIDEYIQNSAMPLEETELEIGEDGEEILLHKDATEVTRVPDLLDTEGNKVYSAEQVEELLARCLAAISNRNSISSRCVRARLYTVHSPRTFPFCQLSGPTPLTSLQFPTSLFHSLLSHFSLTLLCTCRSVLSGDKDVMTMQVDAMFKNGTTPTTNKDWQR